MKAWSLKNCEKTVHAVTAVIALAVCSQPYQYAKDSRTVTWQKLNTLVITDCRRCTGKRQEARKKRTGFRKPVLQVRISETVPERSMP